MKPSIRLPAPAKLNLFLHITGRRPDGYHLLQTVFQLLDVGDELTLTRCDDGQIHRAYSLPGVSAGQDIVMRAARLLQQHCKISQGAEIQLEKRLTMGGGLGGGSSDAATTLLGLNTLWDCGMSVSELAKLGLALGADVPVFVLGHSAWAEGVGEDLTPLDLAPAWYVVLNPGINVSTAEVFSDSQLIRDCPPITIRDFLAGRGRDNVCQPVVSRRYPEIARALEALNTFGRAMLTGTGACVFAGFDDERRARQAWDTLSGDWQGFVAKGVRTSPVHALLRESALAE